jgi:hypothetical protein
MVTLDDATSAIFSADPVEEEGAASSFGGLARWSRDAACTARSTAIVAAANAQWVLQTAPGR